MKSISIRYIKISIYIQLIILISELLLSFIIPNRYYNNNNKYHKIHFFLPLKHDNINNNKYIHHRNNYLYAVPDKRADVINIFKQRFDKFFLYAKLSKRGQIIGKYNLRWIDFLSIITLSSYFNYITIRLSIHLSIYIIYPLLNIYIYIYIGPNNEREQAIRIIEEIEDYYVGYAVPMKALEGILNTRMDNT